MADDVPEKTYAEPDIRYDEEGKAHYTLKAGPALTITSPEIQKLLADAQLTEQHYAQIGRVAAQWAYFETVIDGWLHTFANVKAHVGVCFTAQFLGPRARIDAFIALVKQSGASKRWNQQLEDFAKDVVAIGEKRNRAVHDVWVLNEPSQPIRLEFSARRKVRIEQIPASTDSLKELVFKIAALRGFFEHIASDIFTELHAAPLAPPPASPE